MSQFSQYLGVDYSGAATPTRSLTGLRVYRAGVGQEPAEVSPMPGAPKYFTRRGLAEWLVEELREGPPALVGIDHGFSFPVRYFETHNIPRDWPVFLEDFRAHWPTDDTSVERVRQGGAGRAGARSGNSRWRRLAEERCRAKSVFHFDVQGSVAKSTHAGLPWLLHLRRQLGDRLHFWPFDGWTPPRGSSVVAEVYPALWSGMFPSQDRNGHQHDAYSVARWMQEQDAAGGLGAYFSPALKPTECTVARVEGWIFGLL